MNVDEAFMSLARHNQLIPFTRFILIGTVCRDIKKRLIDTKSSEVGKHGATVNLDGNGQGSALDRIRSTCCWGGTNSTDDNSDREQSVRPSLSNHPPPLPK